MPVVENNVAKFEPLQPGRAKFTLNHFNAFQRLGASFAQRIELIVVRKNNEARLADWHSPAADGFITILPKNAKQRALDFEFEVGPEVVNPMAFDNSGDYVLRIRDQSGVVMSFVVGMQRAPHADTAFVFKNDSPAPNTAANTAAPAANVASAPSAVNNPFANTAPAPAPEAKKGSGLGKIIIAIVLLLLIAGGAIAYFTGMLDGLFGGSQETVKEQVVDEKAQDEEAQDSSASQEASATDTSTEESTASDVASSTEAASAQSSTPAATVPCQIVGDQGTDAEILSRCLSSKPSNEQINQLIKDALNNNRCDLAARLLSSKARSANGSNYAYVLAVMSDPNNSVTTKCIGKDSANSDYWYKAAAKDAQLNKQAALDLAKFLTN